MRRSNTLSSIASSLVLAAAGLLGSGCATWNETLTAEHVRKPLESDQIRGKEVIADLSGLPDTLRGKVGRNSYVFEEVPSYFRDVMIRLLATETRLSFNGGPAHRQLEKDYLAALDPKADPSTWDDATRDFIDEEAKKLAAAFEASSGPAKRIVEEELAVFEAWREQVDPKLANPKKVDPNVALLREARPGPGALVLRPTAALSVTAGSCSFDTTLTFTDDKGATLASGEGHGEGSWSVPGEVKTACRKAAGDAFDRALNGMIMGWK